MIGKLLLRRWKEPSAALRYGVPVVAVAVATLITTSSLVIFGQTPPFLLAILVSGLGELSALIAHELNQPLGAILNNTEVVELILNSSSPNLDEIKDAVSDIRRDNQRASEVIRRVRSLLKKSVFEPQQDLNESLREVFEFVSVQAVGGVSRAHGTLVAIVQHARRRRRKEEFGMRLERLGHQHVGEPVLRPRKQRQCVAKQEAHGLASAGDGHMQRAVRNVALSSALSSQPHVSAATEFSFSRSFSI